MERRKWERQNAQYMDEKKTSENLPRSKGMDAHILSA
jgi:hypothetical protein